MTVLTRTWAILIALTALSLMAGRPGHAGSIGLLVSGWVAPTALGYAFVIAQAIVVGVFAELQFVGLRRSEAAA